MLDFDEQPQHIILEKCWAKTILLSQNSQLFSLFSSSNFNMQGHILSTAADPPLTEVPWPMFAE
jgi:hypothetical protein